VKPDAKMAAYLARSTKRTHMASDARLEIGRPKGQCTWCGKPVMSSRRTWCSGECIAQWDVLASTTVARHMTWRRDNGVCASCGVDTERIKRIFQVLWMRTWGEQKVPRLSKGADLLSEWIGRNVAFSHTAHMPHLWEMDHIVPVVEGGGGLGLDNLRTLCVPCHHAETAKLRRRLSKSLNF